MFNTERRQLILERLHRDGRIVATELSAELGVCEDTIRRDLRNLAAEGCIQRVHGGALLSSPASANYAARQKQASSAKRQIAQIAAGLVQNGQVIILDGGTTNALVARCFPTDLHATVITNSLPAALALKNHAEVEIIFIGGRVYKESLVAIGAAAIESLRKIRADLCMLGVCSLHPEIGLTTPNLEESYIKQAMIESAADVVALVSPEKLGTAATYVVAPLKELTYVVTAREVPKTVLTPYEQQGIIVLQA